VRRLTPLIATLAAACVLVLAAAATSPADEPSPATARAWGISITVPGQGGAGTRVLTAPGDAVSFDGSFAYPGDGSVASASSVTTSVSATSGVQARASASATVSGLSLFGGEITASSVTGETHALANPSSASADFGVSGVSGLVALGQPVSGSGQVSLADWGYLVVLSESSNRLTSPTPGDQGAVTALEVVLTADHDGLPAGSQLLFGHAEANAQANRPPPPPKTTETKTTPTTTTTPKPSNPSAPRSTPPFVPGQPPNVTPKLTPGGYVFPVYGPSSFVDTFGAFRGDVPGGWHHGDDIFAPLGAPVLAVANGTVFSVGWNRVGGWRLWLRDTGGNEFYYAHLSAYSPLAVNGALVHAGDVLGFVGNTGDAEGTPYHLHFEIHPVGLLGLGYDGAVDPTSYLLAWKRLQDLNFDTAAGWVPAVHANAPKAGAILIQSTDISTASGLDPDSLARAMSPSAAEGEGGPLLSQAQKPAKKPARSGG
jgi:murein DD-endopeptidase MepM/ murein hydrolase activator NlpD